jgi:hypothetical protein
LSPPEKSSLWQALQWFWAASAAQALHPCWLTRISAGACAGQSGDEAGKFAQIGIAQRFRHSFIGSKVRSSRNMKSWISA